MVCSVEPDGVTKGRILLRKVGSYEIFIAKNKKLHWYGATYFHLAGKCKRSSIDLCDSLISQCREPDGQIVLTWQFILGIVCYTKSAGWPMGKLPSAKAKESDCWKTRRTRRCFFFSPWERGDPAEASCVNFQAVSVGYVLKMGRSVGWVSFAA